MKTYTYDKWRDLIHAYLHAYRDDVQGKFALGLSGSEAQFLNECGTDAVRQGHDTATKALLDRLKQPPSRESYEVIEESASRILAQVCSNRNSPHEIPVPYWTTRFLLIKEEAVWRIAGIFHPCISCNKHGISDTAPPSEPGKCCYCRGKGTGFVPHVQIRGFWIFKQRYMEIGPCERCGGSGKCQKCAGEAMPGWHCVFSLDGLRHL